MANQDTSAPLLREAECFISTVLSHPTESHGEQVLHASVPCISPVVIFLTLYIREAHAACR